tara:strand:+ start:25 stop:387 length:363 start_codon:yes stop_codon:yes gene_type:complete
MTTTPTKKLKESNFGFIHYSSALAHYMDKDLKIAMEVFSILENKYFFQDWGIVESDSIKTNNHTIKEENGGSLLGVYLLSTGRKIWIMTVGYGLTEDKMDLENYTIMDYNNTCIMFPEDY